MTFAEDIEASVADLIELGGEDFVWDGETYQAVVNRNPQGDLGHYDSLAGDATGLLVLAEGFPRPFPGSAHQFNGARWEVRRVRELPGALDILLTRMIA